MAVIPVISKLDNYQLFCEKTDELKRTQLRFKEIKIGCMYTYQVFVLNSIIRFIKKTEQIG